VPAHAEVVSSVKPLADLNRKKEPACYQKAAYRFFYLLAARFDLFSPLVKWREAGMAISAPISPAMTAAKIMDSTTGMPYRL